MDGHYYQQQQHQRSFNGSSSSHGAEGPAVVMQQQQAADRNIHDLDLAQVQPALAGASAFGGDDHLVTRSVGGLQHQYQQQQPHLVAFGSHHQQRDSLGAYGLAPPKFVSTSSSSLSNKPPPASFGVGASGAAAPPSISSSSSATAAAAAAAAAAAGIRVPELPPFDGFLEANDHVFLDGRQGVGGVAALLEACFQRLRVDFAFCPDKCKWKAARFGGARGGGGGSSSAFGVGGGGGGVGPASSPPLAWHLGLASGSLPFPFLSQQRAGHGASVDFRCRCYQAGGERLVVEFQRREGDYFLMRDAFEAFLAAASAAGLVLPSDENKAATGLLDLFPSCLSSSSSHMPAFLTNSGATSGAISAAGLGGSSGSMTTTTTIAVSSSSSSTTVMTTTMAGTSSSTTTTTTTHTRRSSSASSSFLPLPGFGRLSTTTGGGSSSSSQQQPSPPRAQRQHPPRLLDSLAPLLAMARAPCRMENLEAAQALAKLSASEDNRALLTEGGAIPALVALVERSPCPEVQRAVVAALSNLSESASCKHPLVEAGAATGLLRLVQAGGWDEAAAGVGGVSVTAYRALETRRESARTLANLSEEHAAAIVREVGKEAVVDLMRRVDSLRDERLRMHARRLKARVGVCC